jgi:hypothetical protein
MGHYKKQHKIVVPDTYCADEYCISMSEIWAVLSKLKVEIRKAPVMSSCIPLNNFFN